jgi:isopropylmalate/homocitrate/citramalate synthase
MSGHVTLCDVGPRDGLQTEAVELAPQVRAELCRRLAAAGLPRVEATSFVNPARVPQMGGAEDVVAALELDGGTRFAGLVLNERGYERAVATGLREIHYAFPVTDEFCRRNQGSSVAEALAIGERLIDRAAGDGVRITVTLSVAFGCPFEGPVAVGDVVALASRLAARGPDEIGLADTVGVGVPTAVRAIVRAVAGLVPAVGCHFHNTRNTGFANVVAAVEAGATHLETSVGGVGGCPVVADASGNVATEDVVYLLHGMGYVTGVDLDAVIACARWLGEQLGHPLPGRLHRVGASPSYV